MKCRKVTTDLKAAFKKLYNKYGIEEIKDAAQQYANDIAGRTLTATNKDFFEHRFSLYEFLTQKNGFLKFVNK